MNETGKSTLYGKTAKLVGFGFDKHPTRLGWSIHIVFYWVKPDDWVICLSETKTPQSEEMRPNLGNLVPGEFVAPYAQRHVKGVTSVADFKKFANEVFGSVVFEWWEELAN